MIDLAHLPGGERVARGLSALARGEETADSLLLTLASRRLADPGLALPPGARSCAEPELALYRSLSDQEDPYLAYRTALAELDSFLSTLESLGGANASLPRS